MTTEAPVVPAIQDHPDWPTMQLLIDRETTIGKLAAPVATLLAAGAPVPAGNVELLRDALVNAGYLYVYDDGSVQPTEHARI